MGLLPCDPVHLSFACPLGDHCFRRVFRSVGERYYHISAPAITTPT